jgi:hypothetical protein
MNWEGCRRKRSWPNFRYYSGINVKGLSHLPNPTFSIGFEDLRPLRYVGVLISFSLFLFAAQPKEFFLDGLKKLEQRSHKCVELRGEYVE